MTFAEDLVLDFDPETGNTTGATGTAGSADSVGTAAGLGADIDQAMLLVLGALRTLPVTDAVVRGTKYQNWLLAFEAEQLARNKATGASDRDNERLAGEGRPSTKSETKKRVKRANAVDENPDLANDLASGELGPEQVDAIADAAAKTGGDAACSEELIDEIKHSSPDDANNIAKRWAADHNDPGDGDTPADKRNRRQRRRREATKFRTKDDCSAILIKGDDESINEIWNDLNTTARKLWRKDGGRDLPKAKHPRTRKQRLFDAAHQTLTNTNSTNNSGSGKVGLKGSGARINLWVRLDDFVAGKHNAYFADGSLAPKTVLARYMCTGTIAATVFDKNGEVLHHGREHRYATPAQIRGLIARDKGCVRCRADIAECEAHHLIPWTAPDQGETNIEQLALVCTDCHHYIHDTNQTLYRNTKGLWKLRPATPNETPSHNPPSAENRPNQTTNCTHKVRHE